jgi:hypothetical protein
MTKPKRKRAARSGAAACCAAEIKTLKAQLLFVSMLAAETPQFFNLSPTFQQTNTLAGRT